MGWSCSRSNAILQYQRKSHTKLWQIAAKFFMLTSSNVSIKYWWTVTWFSFRNHGSLGFLFHGTHKYFSHYISQVEHMKYTIFSKDSCSSVMAFFYWNHKYYFFKRRVKDPGKTSRKEYMINIPYKTIPFPRIRDLSLPSYYFPDGINHAKDQK